MLLTGPNVTLILAGFLALLNLWLSVRVGQVRRSEKVSVGDGGNERVIRRMRAHANFTENAWLVFALVLAIEYAVGSSSWLWIAAGLFVVARIGHALGMDGWSAARGAGTVVTFMLELVLAIWAISIPLTAYADRAGPVTEAVMPAG